MDGMNWFRANEADAQLEQAEERVAFRRAMIATLVAVVLGIGLVLALSLAGMLPAAAIDVQTSPAEAAAFGGP